MKNFKIYYFICILFLLYSINLLIDDYYSINYVIVEEQDSLFCNDTNFIICIQFDQIKEKDQLFLNQKISNDLKSTKVPINDFLNYSINSIEFNLNDKSPFNVTSSYLINDFVCFYINHFDLDNNPFIEKLVQNYFIRLYAYSDGKIPYYFDYIYYKYEFINKMIYLKIDKQRIFGENYLKLQSKCLTHDDQVRQTRFICLNKCFKKYKMNFAKYDRNDLIKLNLSLISNIFDNKIQNNSFKKIAKTRLTYRSIIRLVKIMNETSWKMVAEFDELNFKDCISNCKELDCFYEAFDVVRVRDAYYEKYLKDEKKINVETITFRAYYSMTVHDFFGQLFGLLTLFTNTSIMNTIPLIIYLIARNFKKHNNFYFKLIINLGRLRKMNHLFFKLIFLKFQHFLISISLVYVIYESFQMIKEHNHKLIYPNKTINLDFERKPLKLILCFPIESIMFNDSIIEKGRNEKILNNFTINQIIEMTNDIKNKFIKSIYVNTFETTEVKWRTTNELLFKNETFNNTNLLSRCFNIEYDEPFKIKYKSIIPLKYLVIFGINFHDFRSVYLVERDQNFSSNMINLKSEFIMGKMKLANSRYSKKSNCKDYNRYENFKCKKKRVCLDLCINKKYFDKYSNVSINSVIDFNILDLSLDRYFTSHFDDEIIEECLSIFKKRDCTEAYYFETLKTSYNSIPNIITINLNYEKTTERELDQSSVKIIFDIINLVIIFFSTNAKGLLSFMILLIKKRFQNIRIPKIITITICLIGFLIHNFFIFNSLLKENLIENTYFTKIKTPFKLPNVIFCIYEINDQQFNRDANVKFTRKYLDELSSINNYDEIFSIISYFNRTHRNYYYEFNKLNPEIEITHFYYLRAKCFEISTKIEYFIEDFYWLTTRNIMGVHFSKNFTRKSFNFIYFLFRDSDLKQFSEVYPFRIHYESDNELDRQLFYEIKFEYLEFEREDKFELLKNPSSLFNEKSNINDESVYVSEMKRKFRNLCNKTTKEVFLESDEDINLEIDDDLFRQFYLQIQNVSDHRHFHSLNKKRNSYNVYAQIGTLTEADPGFAFSLGFSKRVIVIINEINWSKLLLNLLNTLSLWLDVCILDLYTYFNKLFNLIYYFNHILIRSKMYLKCEFNQE